MVRSRIKQRVFVLVSAAFFLGSAAIHAGQLYSTATAEPTPTPVETDQNATLTEQERGYELVLQREPDNVVALEGLATTRLQQNNGQGAIAPLEKLVKLNPERADYAALLSEAQQKSR